MHTGIPLFSFFFFVTRFGCFWRVFICVCVRPVKHNPQMHHKSLPLVVFHSKKLEMMIPYLCLCAIVERAATQRNLWKAICLLAFVWSNPDRHRRKGSVFRAFVCPHISGRDSCDYSMGPWTLFVVLGWAIPSVVSWKQVSSVIVTLRLEKFWTPWPHTQQCLTVKNRSQLRELILKIQPEKNLFTTPSYAADFSRFFIIIIVFLN